MKVNRAYKLNKEKQPAEEQGKFLYYFYNNHKLDSIAVDEEQWQKLVELDTEMYNGNRRYKEHSVKLTDNVKPAVGEEKGFLHSDEYRSEEDYLRKKDIQALLAKDFDKQDREIYRLYDEEEFTQKEIAEMLQTNYHIIIPILDGHAGSDKRFTTIENNALEIIEFINDKLDGSVLLIGGLSLGGQILLEILSHRKDICKYAIVESALVIPSKFTYFMIKPAFGSCYGLIKYKWFSKLQFKSLRIKQYLFDNYYKDTCAITKGDMIAFLQENSLYSLKDGIEESEATVHIFVGEKENHSMKKSAELIHKKLQNSSIQVLPNMYHGEFSINHADDYVRRLLEIIEQR